MNDKAAVHAVPRIGAQKMVISRVWQREPRVRLALRCCRSIVVGKYGDGSDAIMDVSIDEPVYLNRLGELLVRIK